CEEIILKYHPILVSIEREEDANFLQTKYPLVNFVWGEQGLNEVASFKEGCIFLNALVGMIGLKPTILAIKKRHTILLANKETLVVGGELVMKLAKKMEVSLIPIDSEHSAIMQCLNQHPIEEVKNIIITASGGSFRHLTRDALKNVTVEDALKHPNWSMGHKITIDSATMVNKGLEVIEAHHLFALPYDKISTILHPESIVHSMVEYQDHSVMAQLAQADMRIPIQYALTYPHKYPFKGSPLDFNTLKQLTFLPLSLERFPCLKLAYEVGVKGGILPAVYNASNETAVELFLHHKITFLQIEDIIFEAVLSTSNQENPSLEELLDVSKRIKKQILNRYSH
ncbi:MAG: 1-deoxy-D-xylulose-5-phosphate reductoisomerase, partial [Bacilli bacterium]